MLDASLVVVNYRTARRTLDRVDALVSGPDRPAELVIVDNSPHEGLGTALSARHPFVCYVPMTRNIGFAAAVNLGLARVTGERIVLLNPDADPAPGCLSELVSVLRDDAGAAAAAPRLVPLDDGARQAPCALRRDPDLWTTLAEHTAWARLLPHDWLAREYFLDGCEPVPVAGAMVQGACLALSRRWLDRVGLFDERFFLYWEETDWCRRARAAGGRVLYCGALRCRHEGGASSESATAAARHFWRGFWLYHRKHGGLSRTAALRVLLPLGVAAEYAILTAAHVARRGGDARPAADRARIGAKLTGL